MELSQSIQEYGHLGPGTWPMEKFWSGALSLRLNPSRQPPAELEIAQYCNNFSDNMSKSKVSFTIGVDSLLNSHDRNAAVSAVSAVSAVYETSHQTKAKMLETTTAAKFNSPDCSSRAQFRTNTRLSTMTINPTTAQFKLHQRRAHLAGVKHRLRRRQRQINQEVRDRVDDMHKKCTFWLVNHCHTVLLPNFYTSDMTKKRCTEIQNYQAEIGRAHV